MATTTRKGTTKGKTAAKSNGEKNDKQVSARAEAKARREAEIAKARQARIDAGEIVVTKTHEFETSTRSTKSFEAVGKIIELLKAAKGEPVVFSDVARQADVKYPEDYITVAQTLEHQGLVERFEAKVLNGEQRRRSVAYRWIG